jgi:hypothetical protein
VKLPNDQAGKGSKALFNEMREAADKISTDHGLRIQAEIDYRGSQDRISFRIIPAREGLKPPKPGLFRTHTFPREREE